jgi:polar amino acid transport system substrate-binding protein
MRTRFAVLAATAAALVLAACAPADETPAAPTTGGETTTAASQTSAAGTPTTTAAADLETITAGKLTIATSEPSYEPWMVDDDPTNGKGFETAVAYAVADQLGYSHDDVVWVRDTFDQIIAPGVKDFDFAINQVSITDERKASLDFSSPYYETTQAVVTVAGSKADGVTTIAGLKDLKLGAMVGTTSLTVAQDIIAPTTEIAVYNDNEGVKQALGAGLIDAFVIDLPTALYIAAAELDNGVVVGQLPGSTAGGDQFGLVLDKGSPLTAAVTSAVDALREDGTLADLESQWLTDAAGAPVLQ